MERSKAELVHMLSCKVLSPDWNPTISQQELNEANRRLEEQHVQYRWRWLNQKIISLYGSATLHIEAIDAAA